MNPTFCSFNQLIDRQIYPYLGALDPGDEPRLLQLKLVDRYILDRYKDRQIDPYLGALDPGDEPRLLQLQPISLVQLGTDQEVEIDDLVVLPDESGGQAELGVGLDLGIQI